MPPHIYHTWVRTHLDPIEYKRRPIFHWVALVVPIGISLLALFNGYGDKFNLLLGLYGGWHIARQSIGLQKFLARYKSAVNERIIYAVYFYFLFHNVPSSKELWDVFLTPRTLGFSRTATEILLFVITIQFLLQIRKGLSDGDKFTLVTGVYFISLTHMDIHPLLITAMATIAHNIQYQVWMWNYEKKFFSKFHATMSLMVCLVVGLLTALIPDEGLWIYFSQAYLGFVLWHYFIDGYIWRASESRELAQLYQTSLDL